MPQRTPTSLDVIREPWQRGFIRGFQERFGRPPDLDAPQRYTDKLAWRILFENDPLSRIYGNALFAPYYARAVAGDDLTLATRFGVYRHFSARDRDDLPSRFRLRAIHGSQPAIWIDGSSGNEAKSSKGTIEDLNAMIGRPADQWRPPPAGEGIVAEEWPADDSDDGPTAFRFHCFSGLTADLTWFLETDRPCSGSRSIGFYDEKLQPVGLTQWAGQPVSPAPFIPPANWDRIVGAATALASDFDYVRVDLLNCHTRVVFDKVEVFPREALHEFDDPEFDRSLGSHWSLQGQRSPPRFAPKPRPPGHGEAARETAPDITGHALSDPVGKMKATVLRDRTNDQSPGTIATSHGNALVSKYIERNGVRPDMENPKTFSEKLLVRVVHSQDPLHDLYSNKLISPYFAAAKAGALLDFPTRYGVYQELTVEELEALPKSFVLKGSHASGVNRLVPDRDEEDLEGVVEWMNSRFKSHRNAQGKVDESAVIIAEEFLDDGAGKSPADMKFHCFRSDEGRFRWFLQVFHDRAGNMQRQVLDEDLLPAKFDFTGKSTEPDRKFIPPARFEEMIEISRRISEGFDYVRVDLYNLDGRIVFGEITPFHAGGLLTIAPRSWDYQLGRRWGGDPSRVAGREGSP